MVLDRLRRVTRDGRWIPEIDGLRFLAIAGVLFFHLGGELSARSGRWIPVEPRYTRLFSIVGNGDRGVRLFFVLSGTILSLPFARHLLSGGRPVALGRYFLRRVTRLEPPYLLSVVFFTTLVAVYSHGIPPGFLWHALASSVYLHNVIYGSMTPVNAVSWSLEIEIQFYLLAPLAVQLLRIRGKSLRRGILLGLILLIGAAQHPFLGSVRFTMSVLFYLQYFLAGVLLADIFVLDLPTMRSSWWWDALGVVGLGCMFGFVPAFWSHALLPLPMMLVVVAALRSHGLRKFFGNGWIAAVGGMCYSIYLLHLPLLAVGFKLTKHLIVPRFDYLENFLVQTVTLLPPVLLFCVGFYLLVERPCMDPDWPSKLWLQLTGRRSKGAELLDSAGVSE